MKIKLPKVKRWQKIVRNFSLCVVLLFLALFSVEFETISSKAAFQKLVDSFLIKDYKIIGTVSDSGHRMLDKEKVYIAETTDYYLSGSTYKNKLFWWAGSMLYQYKKSEITMFPISLANRYDPPYVDMIMFAENKDAVSAKLIVYCTEYSEDRTEENMPVFEEEYISDARRGENGYFHFTISRKYLEYKTKEYDIERNFFTDIMSYGDPIWGRENENVRMVVELYNINGERLATEQKAQPDFD